MPWEPERESFRLSIDLSDKRHIWKIILFILKERDSDMGLRKITIVALGVMTTVPLGSICLLL